MNRIAMKLGNNRDNQGLVNFKPYAGDIIHFWTKKRVFFFVLLFFRQNKQEIPIFVKKREYLRKT